MAQSALALSLIFGWMLLCSGSYQVKELTLGYASTFYLTAGSCLILNISVLGKHSPYMDDDMSTNGKIKQTRLETAISLPSSYLEYFAFLVPHYGGSKLVNTPNVIFESNASCWSVANDVGTSGLYSHLSTNGASPIVYDMADTTNVNYYLQQESCSTYVGNYYLVLVAESDTWFTVDVDLSTQYGCQQLSPTTALLVTMFWVFCYCCCPCIVVYIVCRMNRKQRQIMVIDLSHHPNQTLQTRQLPSTRTVNIMMVPQVQTHQIQEAVIISPEVVMATATTQPISAQQATPQLTPQLTMAQQVYIQPMVVEGVLQH